MLAYDEFTEEPQSITPGTEIGPAVKLVFDHSAAMTCTVQRSSRKGMLGQPEPTLVIRGQDRAQPDWFGVELWVPPSVAKATMIARNYPVHRLFPRLHFDTGGKTYFVDLPDVASSDSFAARTFDLRNWCEDPAFWNNAPGRMRLTILVPSTPWFAMEIAGIETEERAYA